MPPTTKQKKAPGPHGIPLIGQALRYQRDPFGYFVWLREKYGDFSQDHSAGIPMVQIYTPEAIEQVLVRNAKNYQKDRIIKSWNLLFGEGLLITEGEKWKKDRKLIQPAFHRERITEYQSLMEAHTQRMTDSLNWSESGPQAINIVAEMTELTLKIAIECLFGMGPETEVSREDYQTISSSLEDIAQWFEFSSGASMILTQAAPWFPFRKKLRYQQAVRQLDKLLERIIQRKREQLSASGSEHSDLLGALIQTKEGSKGSFTNRQIRDQAITFFLAGHETTSLALTYTLRLLALHPEIQEHLRTTLKKSHPDEAKRLLDQIIDESMRLFPPAALTARESINEDEILGYRIKKGTTVIIPTWAIHRDSRFFGEDPDSFNPSRWTAEFRNLLPRAAYLPFGFGPRMCIGFGFALQEMRIILTHLVTHYHFNIRPENTPLPLQSSITMRPACPVILDVQKISSQKNEGFNFAATSS